MRLIVNSEELSESVFNSILLLIHTDLSARIKNVKKNNRSNKRLSFEIIKKIVLDAAYNTDFELNEHKPILCYFAFIYAEGQLNHVAGKLNIHRTTLTSHFQQISSKYGIVKTITNAVNCIEKEIQNKLNSMNNVQSS